MARRTDRYGYTAVMLSGPLEDTIRISDDISFDVAGASFGVYLAASARCDCRHGLAARNLVDVLIDYDQRVWPVEYARHHHHHRTQMRRHAIDAGVADRVMSGDDAALEAHLNAFAPIGEELRGFLDALVARAVDGPSAARLHAVWPRSSTASGRMRGTSSHATETATASLTTATSKSSTVRSSSSRRMAATGPSRTRSDSEPAGSPPTRGRRMSLTGRSSSSGR